MTHPDVTDSVVLHRWSLDHADEFWQRVWDLGIIGDPGGVVSEPPCRVGEDLRSVRFFPQSSFCLAENLLGRQPDAGGDAIVAWREGAAPRRVSWGALRAQVGSVQAALAADGVRPGDRVAAWMPNVIETVVTMLAANALGATFTSTSSDFGVAGVLDRFGQTEPVVLVAADGYRYGGREFRNMDRLAEVVASLPSVRRVVVVSVVDERADLTAVPHGVHWDDYGAPFPDRAPEFLRLAGDHPAYILYSSGTTGKPKCIVHRALGVLLMHLKEQRLHLDIRPGDRVFYFTTCGWMMWNWLVSALGVGATIVLYDGNPLAPETSVLWDMAAAEQLTFLGVSSKYLDAARKAGLQPAHTHDLSSVRTVCSTGSPLSPESYRYVYDGVKPDVHLASISGGTDLCGCFVGGDPTRAVYEGEIQGPMLGMAVEVLSDDGELLAHGAGELTCAMAFPSVPLGFWGDDGSAFTAAYFEKFEGRWTHGDFAEITDTGGVIIHGRSDATLNAGGVRIGTAELYSRVELRPEITEAVAVGQAFDGDSRMVLFVKLADGQQLTPELQNIVRQDLRANLSPRHVPAKILAVADIPRTRSGKISELAVADAVNGRMVRNLGALANAESLDHFRHRPELAE
jgi:acetoacetyl-CoA synthetase